MIFINFQQNTSWSSFFSDLKIAVKVDEYTQWRDGTTLLPLNESGKIVSGTNYDRISWAIIGARLLSENPLGYGLMDRSFRYLAQKNWPESSLAQSHSGWLDFSLGIGVPGVLLVLLAFLFGLKGCRSISEPWKTIIWSIAIGTILLFITTEVSQNIYISCLFFILGATIGFGVGKLKP